MMHPYVGTEHLLIGLLRVDGCVAGRLLTARGFNLYGVREETISLIKEREVSKQKKELEEVEARIETLEKELAQYEAQLSDPGTYNNASQLKDATLKFEQVKKELAAQTKRWEELM